MPFCTIFEREEGFIFIFFVLRKPHGMNSFDVMKVFYLLNSVLKVESKTSPVFKRSGPVNLPGVLKTGL